MKMENKLKNLQIYAVVVCLLMAISPLAMAEEIASNAKSNLNTSIDEVEWQVVWQDDGTTSVEYGEPEIIPFLVAIVYAAYTVYTTYEDIKEGDYVSAIAGLLPPGKVIRAGWKGVNIIKAAANDAKNNGLKRAYIGIQTEKVVLKALGEVKNTQKVSHEVDGVIVTTIPDILNHEKKLVGEIKDYSEANILSNTKQIRAQMKWAQKNDYYYVLYVNDCKKLSGPLQKALDDCCSINKCDCVPIHTLISK